MFSKDSLICLLLTTLTSVLAGVMAWKGYASWLEAISFVTGAVCVWLTVKENIWNFPIGLLNVATFVIVFGRAHLFADAGLQVVYFILGVIGRYQWLYGGEQKTELRISKIGLLELSLVLASVAILTLILWRALHMYSGPAAFWDALTTSISLGAQWMLNRKLIENWIAWIIVDAIYVPLYLYKDLQLTAILYAVFLIMAIMGLLAWRKTLKEETAPVPELATI